MDDLFTRFFSAVYQFHKLPVHDLIPDLTKFEGMTLVAIWHYSSGENGNELTVSTLTAAMKAKGPAVSRILKTLEEKGYIQRQVNLADRRNIYVTLTDAGRKKAEECEQTINCFAHAVVLKMNRNDMEYLIDCLDEFYEVARAEIAIRKQDRD